MELQTIIRSVLLLVLTLDGRPQRYDPAPPLPSPRGVLTIQFLPNSITRSNGQFKAAISSTGGKPYLIQASEDLLNWSSIGVAASSDVSNFIDSASRLRRRFYRLVDQSFFTNNFFSINISKGPISHAQVWLYVLNTDGTQGERLAGPLETGANGSLTLPLVISPTGFVIAISEGGQYFDEVTTQLVYLEPKDQFTAVFGNPTPGSTASVTPLTHIAAAKARADAASGISLNDTVNFANGSVALQFGAPPIISTVPNLAGPFAANQYALLLAAISQLSHELNINPLVLINTWAEDALDGLLDGKRGLTPVFVETLNGAKVPLPGMNQLSNALEEYAVNKGLGAGGPVPLLEPIQLGLNAGGRVAILPTPLPAWVENRRGDVPLEAKGGIPPYTWSYSPAGPAPPFWLTPAAPLPGGLTAGGILFGTPPLLASGSTMSISAPFSVRVQDSAGNVIDMLLRATIVPAPPTITNAPLLPPAREDQAYSFLLKGAGGTPPYSFYNDGSVGGFRPFWLTVGADGLVSGTPPVGTAGKTIVFGICIVDSVGQADCVPLSLDVTSNLPCLSIEDSTVAERDSGTIESTLLVTLDRASASDITVQYQTMDGSAVSGEDYVAVPPRQLTIPAGMLQASITVAVVGDTNVEPDETFIVKLSNPVNATLCRDEATGMIHNDDILPPFTITSAALPSASNQDLQPQYLASVLASGGVPPCSWSASGLPPGFKLLPLESGGQVICDEVDIAGSPGNGQPPAGDYAVTITGIDSLGRKAEKTLTLSISAPAATYKLTVTVAGTGNGSVTMSPPGGNYRSGTVVTLTAAPDGGSTFAGWTGDGVGSTTRTVVMNGNKSVTATFHVLDTISGNWAGTWASTNPSGISGTWTATFLNQGGNMSGTWNASDGSAGTISGSPSSLTFGGSGSGVTFKGSIIGSTISGTFSAPGLSGTFVGSKR